MYKISNNAIELIAGTDNRTSPLYLEAAKSIEADTPKAMGTMKNFITSIEALAAQENVQDARLSGSQGNISRFAGYENIKYAINFLSKNLSGLEVVKELTVIFQSLEAYQAEYIDGYDKQIRLIILEYEAALYMLVTGLSFAMANNIDIQQTGTQIRIVKKSSKGGGSVINKTISDLAKQLQAKDHQSYLKELINARASTPVSEAVDGHLMTETIRTVGDTIDIFTSLISGVGKIGSFAKRTFQTLKRTMFGIIPMIRTALYLRYKKKADTILALEQQIAFVKMNIEQLENIKTMDETQKKEIILRQKAAIEGFQKKAEKLRAELVETERDAATSLKAEEPDLTKEDGEFVLEGVLYHYLLEAKKKSEEEKKKVEFPKTISITLFGKTFNDLKVSLDSYMTDEEKIVMYKQFEEFMKAKHDSCLPTVAKYVTDSYNNWSDKEYKVADIKKAIFDHISIKSIYVSSPPKTPRKDNRYGGIVIMGETKSDEEHGIGIVFRDGKFLDVGQQGNYI